MLDLIKALGFVDQEIAWQTLLSRVLAGAHPIAGAHPKACGSHQEL